MTDAMRAATNPELARSRRRRDRRPFDIERQGRLRRHGGDRSEEGRRRQDEDQQEGNDRGGKAPPTASRGVEEDRPFIHRHHIRRAVWNARATAGLNPRAGR